MSKVEIVIPPRMWRYIKSGIRFPLTETDLGKELEAINKEVARYEKGKALFLKAVSIAAQSLLQQLPLDAKGGSVTLEFTPLQAEKEVDNG